MLIFTITVLSSVLLLQQHSSSYTKNICVHLDLGNILIS
jgi:hypothetical protein